MMVVRKTSHGYAKKMYQKCIILDLEGRQKAWFLIYNDGTMDAFGAVNKTAMEECGLILTAIPFEEQIVPEGVFIDWIGRVNSFTLKQLVAQEEARVKAGTHVLQDDFGFPKPEDHARHWPL